MSAQLVINQAGLSAGTINQARSDGLHTGLVTLSSNGPGDKHEFELLWAPEDDATAASSFIQNTTTTATFSPDPSSVGGSYRIKLTVTTGSTTETVIRIFAILTSQSLRIPALNERANEKATLANGSTYVAESEFNEPGTGPFAFGDYGGWYSALAKIARTVDAGTGGGGTLAGDVTGASGANTVVKLQGNDVSAIAPASGNYLQWNGSAWEPATLQLGLTSFFYTNSLSVNKGDITPSDPLNLVSSLVVFINTNVAHSQIEMTGLVPFSDGVHPSPSATLDLFLFNNDTGGGTNVTLVLKHNASGTTDNRFLCPGGVDYTVPVGGHVNLIYNASVQFIDGGYTGWFVVPVSSSGGSGDVVGPAGAVTSRIATFDGITGKLIQDGGQTIAGVISAATYTPPTAKVYRGGLFSPMNLSYGSGSWLDFFAAITIGSWTDEVQTGITRSGSNITVASAGWYQVNFYTPSFAAGTPPLLGVRMKVNGVMALSSLGYGGSNSGQTSEGRINDAILLAAGDVLTFEYTNATGTTSFSITSGQLNGVDIKIASLSIHRFSL